LRNKSKYPDVAISPCQGWGRGFESLRPLQFFSQPNRVPWTLAALSVPGAIIWKAISVIDGERIEAAAAIIAGARLSGERLAVLPETVRPDTLGEAYAVQDRVHALIADRYGRRIGYKIGCTTTVMQDYLGIHTPCASGVFEAGEHASGAILDFADYRQIGVECEIAVRIGAAGKVEAVIPAIEIVDDRYVDWRQTDAPTLIADDFFAAGCVLGAPCRPVDVGDLASLTGTMSVNGTEVGTGLGSEVMGHPLNALAWLSETLSARGRDLKEGEVVLLGSLVQTLWLKAGDRPEIAISGLGVVRVTVR